MSTDELSNLRMIINSGTRAIPPSARPKISLSYFEPFWFQAAMSPPIPVICDRCRTAGEAGLAPFAALADLLAFTPVPRRAHVNGWDEQWQRAFIAALAVTGSPRRAARAIGKHAFGAEQLRKARGGASFAAAWDAALELARERELAALHDGLADLAAEHEQEHARRRSAILPRAERNAAPPARSDADAEDYPQEFREAAARIRDRLTRARRLLLASLAPDPDKRAAWQLLVGPTDWDRAAKLEAQDDEPFGDGQWSMRRADMLLTAEAGLAAELTGGPDALAPVAADLDRLAAATAAPSVADPGDSEAAAVAAYRARLIADGWTEDGDGNLWSPDRAP